MFQARKLRPRIVRRIAARYDKLATNYFALIKLASIRIWLRAYVSAPSIQGATFCPLTERARSAGEIADFGAPQTSLNIRVTQLSATVGRGFAAEAVVAV